MNSYLFWIKSLSQRNHLLVGLFHDNMTYSCKLGKVAMKNNPRSNSYHSLCEKSMQVAANIIKLPSFSIAKMSLGIGRTLASPWNCPKIYFSKQLALDYSLCFVINASLSPDALLELHTYKNN